jgi:integrase
VISRYPRPSAPPASGSGPVIPFHGLRHSHIELSLQAGVRPDIVSRRVGHATVAFTLERYAHALPAHQADAAEMVAKYLRG